MVSPRYKPPSSSLNCVSPFNIIRLDTSAIIKDTTSDYEHKRCNLVNWIPVIINPSAGRKTTILGELNQVFQSSGTRWSVEITQEEGDGILLAEQMVDRGAKIVAVYGGDGTVSEVATGLAGTDAALGILPGGTGNVLAYEFGIPQNFVQATQILTSEHIIRVVDMGQIGNRKFLLRAGMGFESMVIERTSRRLKDRFGLLAYGIGGLQALMDTRPTEYTLELDGQMRKITGLICTVANAGHLGGLPGMRLSPRVNIEDGLLDVIVLRKVDLKLIMQFMSGNVAGALGMKELQHWQVKRVRIQVDPPQTVQVDGDDIGMTPVELKSLPRALKVIVPR